MRRALIPALALLFGCTVQVGRDPRNTFEIQTEDPPEQSDPAKPALTGADPGTTGDPAAQSEPRPQPIERNWRLGAEREPVPRHKPPREAYEELFMTFRADHHEAMRLRDGFPQRSKTLLTRAAKRLTQMREFLPEADRKPFDELRARYDVLIEEALALQPPLFNAKALNLESELAKEFDAKKIKFEQPQEVSPPRREDAKKDIENKN